MIFLSVYLFNIWIDNFNKCFLREYYTSKIIKFIDFKIDVNLTSTCFNKLDVNEKIVISDWLDDEQIIEMMSIKHKQKKVNTFIKTFMMKHLLKCRNYNFIEINNTTLYRSTPFKVYYRYIKYNNELHCCKFSKEPHVLYNLILYNPVIIVLCHILLFLVDIPLMISIAVFNKCFTINFNVSF